MSEQNIIAIWSIPITKSGFYNIERPKHVKPEKGNGDLYIQINGGSIPGLCSLIGIDESKLSLPYNLLIRDRLNSKSIEKIEINTKSEDRLRFANQNKHSKSSLRPTPWTQARGFPYATPTQDDPNLSQSDKNSAFRAVSDTEYNKVGGIRIALIKSEDSITGEQSIWADFFTGEADELQQALPFHSILWGTECNGGYWDKENGIAK